MIDFNPLLNTCYILTNGTSRTLAYYSHLIPIFFSVFLAILVFFKSSKSTLSRVFLTFVIIFSFWLVADLVTWVANNYFLVYTFWAPVDFIETLMFLSGLYFVLVLINKKDIRSIYKILIFFAALIPFAITVTKNSVLGFNYPVCEAINNEFLLNYRFYVEVFVIGVIFVYTLITLMNKSITNRRSKLLVLSSMFLFLGVFGVTSYLSAVTEYYELNLYALFIIPAFLIAITYSIFSLDIFKVRILSTYFIVFGFIILTASQLLFITSTTNRILTIVTIGLSVGLSMLLFKNLKKESDQRLFIEKISKELEDSKYRLEESNLNLEKANDKLKDVDKLKTEFVSLASHQLRSPLTAIKGYTSMLMEGDYGDLDPKAKDTVERIMESSNNLSLVVEDLLDVTKIEQGGMKYEMEKLDFTQLVSKTVRDLSITAKNKGLILNSTIDDKISHFVNGDEDKLRQVVINLLDNSMKYTKEGSIDISLETNENKLLLKIKDTGAGISKETLGTLFQKFARGDGAKLNSSGSGLGLYLVREIMDAHKGRVWVESEGLGKDSTFFVELDEVKE